MSVGVSWPHIQPGERTLPLLDAQIGAFEDSPPDSSDRTDRFSQIRLLAAFAFRSVQKWFRRAAVSSRAGIDPMNLGHHERATLSSLYDRLTKDGTLGIPADGSPDDPAFISKFIEPMRRINSSGGPRNPEEMSCLTEHYRYVWEAVKEGRMSRSQFNSWLAAEGAKFSKGSPFTDILFRTEGYAGSAITLELMYRHMAVNDPRLAQRIGGHLAFCDSRPSTHAVRNRAGRAVELALPVIGSFLGPVEVACFAGGTGLFASLLMSRLSPSRAADVHIRLFDMDPCAVLAAQRRIRREGLRNVKPCWTNLLSDRTFVTDNDYLNGRFVFAECLGMFDYLPDKLTKSDIQSGHALPAYGHALRKLFSTIRPGGMLVVGNFAPSHPDQAYMELGNWPLILRDEEDMTRLVHKFGVLLPGRGDTVDFERVKGAEDTQILMLLGKGTSGSFCNRKIRRGS